MVRPCGRTWGGWGYRLVPELLVERVSGSWLGSMIAWVFLLLPPPAGAGSWQRGVVWGTKRHNINSKFGRPPDVCAFLLACIYSMCIYTHTWQSLFHPHTEHGMSTTDYNKTWKTFILNIIAGGYLQCQFIEFISCPTFIWLPVHLDGCSFAGRMNGRFDEAPWPPQPVFRAHIVFLWFVYIWFHAYVHGEW